MKGKTNIRAYPEKNSQAFEAGDLVMLSSGQVALWTGTDIAAAGVAGVACADGANNTANANTPIYVITPTQEWRAFPATTKKPTSFTVGVDFKVAQASAGAGYVGTAAGAGAVVVSVKAKGEDGATAGDPMIIRFSNAGCQLLEG